MSRQSDSSSSYMDGIRVKISEKYKPPPKITLAQTYAQRLALNNQLQENSWDYNFDMNSCVKEKMKEWRSARCSIATQRKEKLEKIKCQEELKKTELEVIAAQTDSNKVSEVKSNDNGLLIPTLSNILTPTQLVPQKYVQTLDDASPINISDFEPDTSSPFDNLELKTLNDLEELKLVLQNEDRNKYQMKLDKKNNYPLPNNQTCAPSHNSYYNLSASLPVTDHNQTQAYETSNMPYNTLPASSKAATNGFTNYYGSMSVLHNEYKTVSMNKVARAENLESCTVTDTEYAQAYNMVPDIIKALQNQLNLNIQQEHGLSADTNVAADTVSQIYHSKIKPVEKQSTSEDDKLENPYHSLSKSAQTICESIASMGFPIGRVARACKSIGDDEKKVVEFLLAQSQLMDLGFGEEKVTSALNKSDNNQDKALELLIS